MHLFTRLFASDVCYCDVAGVPSAVRFLSVVRWSGVTPVSTAYVGNSARSIPASALSVSRFSVAPSAHSHQFTARQHQLKQFFPRPGTRPIVIPGPIRVDFHVIFYPMWCDVLSTLFVDLLWRCGAFCSTVRDVGGILDLEDGGDRIVRHPVANIKCTSWSIKNVPLLLFFLNRFVKHWPIFDNFWHTTSGKDLMQTTVVLATSLYLQYLAKCRSRRLAINNSEFILDSTCVSSEMINWKATNTIGHYCISKKSHVSHHILFITACARNVFFLCECNRQTLTPLANSRLNNLHFTR